MSSPFRLIQYTAGALIALILAGCAASMRVNSYAERGFNLATYRTYSFAPADRVSSGDPRLDNNPFFNERMQADIEKQMAAKGFSKAQSSAPDLLVHYHASFAQEVDVNAIDTKYGYCTTGDCRPFVYDAGTLMVDFIDSANRLVWRGWVESSVDGVVDNQGWLEQKVDQAMTRIFAELPPRR